MNPRPARIAFSLSLSILAIAATPHTTARAADPAVIKLDLKTFKFNVRPEIADLVGYNDDEGKLFYYTNGAGEATLNVPADGDYEIVVRASDEPALNERAKFKVSFDGQPLGDVVLLTTDDEKDYTLPTPAKAGQHKLAIEFTNDAYKAGEYDRNLYIHAVTVKRVK